MKGQGSIEYLVVLAIVLVVALIVVGLMTEFGRLGQAGREKISAVGAQAEEISILAALGKAANVTLRLKNAGAEKIEVTKADFDGTTVTLSSSVVINPGDEKLVLFANGLGSNSCSGLSAGDTVTVRILTLYYNITLPNGTEVEIPKKFENVVVTCS